MDDVVTEQPLSHMHAPTIILTGSSLSGHAMPSDLAAVCPPGMEYILGTSMVMVRQLVELFEVFTGIDTNNKYEVLDMAGRRMYFAAEKYSCCARLLCFGSRRPYTILLLNNMGGICLQMRRELTCCYCLCGGYHYGQVKVFTGTDVYIGEIVQDCCDCCCPRFHVKDADGDSKLAIKGPCNCCMCCNVRFSVEETDTGKEIGEIQKKWGGVVKEALTTADTFGVTFPMNYDPRLKCLLLAAVFMIDFMYFEHTDDEKTLKNQGVF